MFKLKSKLIIAVMIIIGTTAFISCEKEKINEPVTNKTNRVQQTKFFKELGDKHNQILDYVGNNCIPENSSPEQRFLIANQFTKSKTNWNDLSKEHQEINQIVENRVKASEKLFSLNKSINLENIFLFDSLDAILDYSLSQIDSNIIITPDEYNQKVNNLINYVYNNYDVYYDNVNDSANIYAIFVADCFVSKASYSFWYNAATDETNPWHNYLDNGDKSLFGKIWHGIKVAAADTWGFVSSGTLGGGYSSDTGTFSITTSFNLGDAIDNAGDVSASVK